MLQIKNLSIIHKKDLRVILNDFSCVLNDGDKAVIILPDKDVDNFSDDGSLNETKSRFIAYADDVSETDYGDALFFAYSYGYVFED